MTNFLKTLFASCLGTLIALFLLFFILMGIGASMASSSLDGGKTMHVEANSILKLSIPEMLPEQTDNVQFAGFSLNEQQMIGVHDLAKSIRRAASDEKIKAIYLTGSIMNHGYASLKIVRDALLQFKESGKPIIAYSLNLDHKNYFLMSVADQILVHPLGFIDMRGFSSSIPFFKEMMEKIGLKFNIYYAGEFKSATEPFRLERMSPENRLQLSEYLQEQLSIYTEQVALSRGIPTDQMLQIFSEFKANSPQRALELNVIDSLAYETDALTMIKRAIGQDPDAKTPFISIEDYFTATAHDDEDYSAKSKIAVVYAEGNITDTKGQESEIGRKYLKILRDIRQNKNIKAVVLRINSGGGSAIMSDEFLREIDQIRNEGKPVVVSMGDYAASGGYYIACHADSIFASPHTLTGSIGVFAMIPNFKVMTGDKIGIDFDTVGTGPMASKFNLSMDWTQSEAGIIQENINHTYETFLNVVAQGRKMTRDQVHEVARGRIWSGRKARELGLVNRIGELPDAIKAAAALASLERYREDEYPKQKDPFQKLLDELQGRDEISNRISETILKESAGELYPYLKEWQEIRKNKGIQMALPVKPVF